MTRLPVVVIVFALSTAACSGNSVAPSNQPDVPFQFQQTNVANLSTNYSYTWQNTGKKANVTQSSTLTSGTATVTIQDATGATVYTGDLKRNGSYSTSVGVTGDWYIGVATSNAAGTLNFRVQRGD
jgi:hypothetical protein